MIVVPSSSHWLWKWRLHNLSKVQEIPLSALRHNREVPGSIPVIVFGNFQVSCSFWPHWIAVEYSQPLTEVSTKEYPWVLRAAGAWSWQLCRHSCAECEIMDGSPTFHPFLCLHDLLRGSFTFWAAVRICTLTLFATMQRLIAPLWLLDSDGECFKSSRNIG
jgi:hypothetical protein